MNQITINGANYYQNGNGYVKFNTLTDYQIADAFGETLSLIYKDKTAELNNDLAEIYAHLDRLDIPRFTEFERLFARETLPSWAKEKLASIEHIQKIRKLYRKMKTEPESDRLNIEKARSVPIIDVLGVAIKRGNMCSCPFHGTDSHPSMKINKNNTCHCFGCGFHGSTIDVFMKLNNVGFKDAVTALSN